MYTKKTDPLSGRGWGSMFRGRGGTVWRLRSAVNVCSHLFFAHNMSREREAQKLERCELARSRRARRSPTSRPAWSMLYIGLVGLSLCCARARHAEALRSGRRQRSRAGRMLGRRAGRRGPVGGVWARSRAVPWCAVPCASRPSHGTLARVRPCVRVRSMWATLGEGESSDGVT